MLFATMYLAYIGGMEHCGRGVENQPPYSSILWIGLAIVAFILILWLRAEKGPTSWDEEDEDDQFYD